MFVNDEILIKNVDIYNFNYENIAFDDVFESYNRTFSSSHDSSTLPLIELNPHAIDDKKVRGKSSLHQRLVVTIEAYAMNIAAREVALNKSAPNFIASSFAWLADEFGCDWRTIKSAINTISNIRLTFDCTHVKRAQGFVLELRKKFVMKIAKQIQIFDLKIERYKKKNRELLNNISYKSTAKSRAYYV